MSGKIKMADFGLILRPQRVCAYPQHNTTSPTHIHKEDQCKSHIIDALVRETRENAQILAWKCIIFATRGHLHEYE
jgi:hypothetical protein